MPVGLAQATANALAGGTTAQLAKSGSSAGSSDAAAPTGTSGSAGVSANATLPGASLTGSNGGGAQTSTSGGGASAQSTGAGIDAGALTAAVTHTSAGQAGASVTPAPSAVALSQLANAVRITIQTQAATGNSMVRIRLSPPELGEVRVSLQQTSAGLVARVVADHASAAQTLQQAAGELRRALEGSGVSLAHLDIGESDKQGAGNAEGGQGAGSGNGDARGGDEAGEDDDGAEATTQMLTLASGSIVNVLA